MSRIKKGDWFILNHSSNIITKLMAVTLDKKYQCTKIDTGVHYWVHFVDDNGKPEFHKEECFTKVDPPEPEHVIRVGDIITGRYKLDPSKVYKAVLEDDGDARWWTAGKEYSVTAKGVRDDDGDLRRSTPLEFKVTAIVSAETEAEPTLESKFSVGDTVTLTNIGNCYPTFTDKAKELGLTQFKKGWAPEIGYDQLLTVIAVGKHRSKAVYGLRDREGKEFLAGDKRMSLHKSLIKSKHDDQLEAASHSIEAIKNNQEENTTMNKTINISVPTTAFATTSTTTVFGVPIDHMDESELYDALNRITREQDQLKAMNKEAKSSRIKGQINKLGEMRNKLVAYIDELPEEE